MFEVGAVKTLILDYSAGSEWAGKVDQRQKKRGIIETLSDIKRKHKTCFQLPKAQEQQEKVD